MTIKAKTNQLKAQFVKSSNDIVYAYGENCEKSDLHVLKEMLNGFISGDKTVIAQLEARGYDLSTLKFSINKK